MKTLKLGTVAGRHDLPVEQYILKAVEDPSDIDGITNAVERSLSEILSPYMGITARQPIDSADYTDLPCYTCSVDVDLYVTGLTSVVIAALAVFARNGVHCRAMHFDRETGAYSPQPVF